MKAKMVAATHCCHERRCKQPVSWFVYGPKGGFSGTYCTEHAKARVRKLNRRVLSGGGSNG